MQVCWRLMFRVANRRALERCLADAVSSFNNEYVVGECKPYWKVPELWEAIVTTAVTAVSVQEQVFAILLSAYRLGTSWSICGCLSEESASGFEGVFSQGHAGARSNVVGLEWASFTVVDE